VIQLAHRLPGVLELPLLSIKGKGLREVSFHGSMACHARFTGYGHNKVMLDAQLIRQARFVLSVTAYEWLHPQQGLTAKALARQKQLFQRVLRAIVRLGSRTRPFAKPGFRRRPSLLAR